MINLYQLYMKIWRLKISMEFTVFPGIWHTAGRIKILAGIILPIFAFCEIVLNFSCFLFLNTGTDANERGIL